MAHHAGAADATVSPEEMPRATWWSTARFILQRDPAKDDVVATRGQAVALPSADPARRVNPTGQWPSAILHIFAAPIVARLDSRVVGMPVTDEYMTPGMLARAECQSWIS